MKIRDLIIAGFAAGAFISTGVLAQSKPDADKASSDSAAAAMDPSAGAQKQHTGGTAGAEPQQYGGAQKQHTQGTAGYQPQQYGTDWSRARKQPNNQ